MKQTQQKLSSMATFGDSVSSEQAINSGNVMGLQSAGQARGMSKSLSEYGSDAIMKASQDDSFMKTGKMIGATTGEMNAYNAEAKSAGKAISDVIKDLAKELSEGKTTGDQKRVSHLNSNYKDGGYVGFQEDNALIQSMQGAGQMGGLKDIMNNPEKIKDFISKAQAEAAKIGKLDELNKDLERAGLLEDGKINPDNWVQAKSFLQANNMNSHNALIAGGMAISGAIGDNSTVKVDALNSTQSGNKSDEHFNDKKIHTGADYRSALQGFIASGGDENDVKGFIDYVKNSQLSESHKKGIFGHLAAGIANATGMEQHDAEMAVAAGGASLGAIGLNSMVGNPIGKLTSSKDSMPNHSSNPNSSINTNDTKNNSINDGESSNMKHGDSLKRYGNAEAHNASIAQVETNSNSLYKNVARHLGDIMKATGVGAAIYETAGAMGNVFTAIRDTG
ncbi:MAG: hypothetical protein AB7U85_11285, partial [Alphaproteobacteria bacterium]